MFSLRPANDGGIKMPAVWLDMCERYPVYELAEEADWTVRGELTQDEIDFVKRANVEYRKAQIILRQAYEGGQSNEQPESLPLEDTQDQENLDMQGRPQNPSG